MHFVHEKSFRPEFPRMKRYVGTREINSFGVEGLAILYVVLAVLEFPHGMWVSGLGQMLLRQHALAVGALREFMTAQRIGDLALFCSCKEPSCKDPLSKSIFARPTNFSDRTGLCTPPRATIVFQHTSPNSNITTFLVS
jgi:hypothetical protein